MEHVIAYADKTVLKISGVKVKGLKPEDLEEKMNTLFQRPVRLIGVTSDSVEMDVYSLEPEQILENQEGLITAISMVPGLTATEVVQIASAEKARAVSADQIVPGLGQGCARERWL